MVAVFGPLIWFHWAPVKILAFIVWLTVPFATVVQYSASVPAYGVPVGIALFVTVIVSVSVKVGQLTTAAIV